MDARLKVLELHELHPAERAVLMRFAHYLAHSSGPAMLSVREILVAPGFPPHVLTDGMKRLADRGWLLCGGSLHWKDEDRCLLISEGLTLAANEAVRMREAHPPSDSPGAHDKIH